MTNIIKLVVDAIKGAPSAAHVVRMSKLESMRDKINNYPVCPAPESQG